MFDLRQNRKVDTSYEGNKNELNSLNARFYLHPVKTSHIYRKGDFVSLANEANLSILL